MVFVATCALFYHLSSSYTIFYSNKNSDFVIIHKKKLFWIKLSRSCYTKNKRRSIFKSNRHEEQPPQVHTQITHVYVCVPLQPHQCAWFGEPSVRSGAAVDPPRGLGPALSASRFHF